MLKKDQETKRNTKRTTGAIIDCEEIVIFVFPPPREHGKPHCHVRSKKPRKAKAIKYEVFPEIKVYLDGSEIIIITEGFSKRDIRIIVDIIFNDVSDDQISNDKYLLSIWEELHG